MGRIAARIGTGLALIFIGVVLARGFRQIPVLDYGSARLWLACLGCFALYASSQIVGAVAWRAVLQIYGQSVRKWRGESQLLVSQIGKYIPGNVAHLFGRVALAREDGVPPTVAGAAILLEVGFLLTTGLLIVCLTVLVSPCLAATLTSGLPTARFSGLLICLLIAVFIALIIGQVVIWRRAGRPKLTASKLFLPLSLHAVNFGLLGASLWCAALVVAPETPLPLPYCVAVFTIAWVAGFLMPGAPGGVGVRDGIIALGLELLIGPGAGLGIAVIHRIVSVIGDLVIFALGIRLRRAWPSIKAK